MTSTDSKVGPWWIVTHEWQGCQQMSTSAEWYASSTLCGTEEGARNHIALLQLRLSPRPGYVTNRNISEPIQVAPLRVSRGEGPWLELDGEVCPFTMRPYFMHLLHPELGLVPTYGGPFDSYTVPQSDANDGEDELRCERYDHDAGNWVEGGEPTGLYITNEAEVARLTNERDAALSRLAAMEADAMALPQLVDVVWQAATDSQEVPSQEWADELIAQWRAALSKEPLTGKEGK